MQKIKNSKFKKRNQSPMQLIKCELTYLIQFWLWKIMKCFQGVLLYGSRARFLWNQWTKNLWGQLLTKRIPSVFGRLLMFKYLTLRCSLLRLKIYSDLVLFRRKNEIFYSLCKCNGSKKSICAMTSHSNTSTTQWWNSLAMILWWNCQLKMYTRYRL